MSTSNDLRSEDQTSNSGQGHVCHKGLGEESEGLLVIVGKTNDSVKLEKSSSSNSDRKLNGTEHPIGRGAFGDVWSATDPRTGRSVALKRLTNIFATPQFAIRVFREVNCLTSLHHDNILCVIDILQLPSVDEFQDLFLLTEAMDSDLHRIIVSNQILTTPHIKVFVYQILRGLKYLHSAKIIHRDIKPANLLVNADCKLKICDFGLVRFEDMDQAMTQDVATQFYRAPEMLMGAMHYSTSVDLWAAGCVLAELLNRRILFRANSLVQQLDLIVDMLGTPQMEDMKYACDAARNYILRKATTRSEVNAQLLHCLSPSGYSTQDAVQLLRQLLVFNPDRRATAAKALHSNFVKYGRNCYHSTICSCHPSRSRRFRAHDELPFPADFDDLEPSMPSPLFLQFESKLKESPPYPYTIRNELHRLCLEIQKENENLLTINTRSSVYEQFTECRSSLKKS